MQRNTVLKQRCLEAAKAYCASPDANALAAFDAARRALSPMDLAALDQSLRRALFALDIRSARDKHSGGRHPSRRDALLTVLHDTPAPALALLLLHDRDGLLREAAVKAMPDPVADPAALTALLLRSNDWAEPVRQTALARLLALLPALSTGDLVPMVPLTLDRGDLWQRGGAEAARVLTSSPLWPEAVERLLVDGRAGPLARLLRQCLKAGQMDAALPRLALNAASAQVRAAATQTVLTGQARWRSGWKWTETYRQGKPWPTTRREAVWVGRQVDLAEQERTAILACAAQDRSAMVRKLAADHLIAAGPVLPPETLMALRQDKSPAVTERMAYYDKKWGGLTAQDAS